MAVSVYTGAGGGVASFNGRKGKVVPADGDYTKAQVGLGNVDNTSDANKPISNATQAALNKKQSKITANGILKGDGSGNVTAASETEVELVSLPNICNPNLLDNWYFGNPVNQRGQASYTGDGYTIDRWIRHRYDSNSITTLNEGYVSIVGYGANLDQILEGDISKSLRGKEVTLSILARGNVAIISEDFTGNYQAAYLQSETFMVVSKTITVRSDSDRFSYHIQPQDGDPSDVIAVKLELGSQQTLAHQENGVWVLNEIPDYGEQLLKCQRYLRPAALSFIVSNSGGIYYASAIMQSPYPMRGVPAIVNGDYTAQVVREVTGGQTATVSQVFPPSVYGSFTMQLTPGGSTIPDFVYIDPTGFNPLLSAEL